jgi:hypothetical protein
VAGPSFPARTKPETPNLNRRRPSLRVSLQKETLPTAKKKFAAPGLFLPPFLHPQQKKKNHTNNNNNNNSPTTNKLSNQIVTTHTPTPKPITNNQQPLHLMLILSKFLWD